MSTTSDLAKAMIKEAAYQNKNLGQETFTYLMLKEAFEAGMKRATFNGLPGVADAPDFEQWITMKAFED